MSLGATSTYAIFFNFLHNYIILEVGRLRACDAQKAPQERGEAAREWQEQGGGYCGYDLGAGHEVSE